MASGPSEPPSRHPTLVQAIGSPSTWPSAAMATPSGRSGLGGWRCHRHRRHPVGRLARGRGGRLTSIVRWSATVASSNATGIDGNQADDGASSSGAAYVYTRDGVGTWSQQAYVKASNTDVGDYFGISVTVSGDGNTLAVGSYLEDSSATGAEATRPTTARACERWWRPSAHDLDGEHDGRSAAKRFGVFGVFAVETRPARHSWILEREH